MQTHLWWHQSTFPAAEATSIIDKKWLDFCVRNGNRYFPLLNKHHHRYSYVQGSSFYILLKMFNTPKVKVYLQANISVFWKKNKFFDLLVLLC